MYSQNQKSLLTRNAVVYVRTDAKFTREATIEALETAFPVKSFKVRDIPRRILRKRHCLIQN